MNLVLELKKDRKDFETSISKEVSREDKINGWEGNQELSVILKERT